MRKLEKTILIVSVVFLAAAVGLFVFAFTRPKALPELPAPDFVCEIRNIETHDNGLIKIIKFPVLASENGFDYTEVNKSLRALEDEDFENGDFPLAEGQNASYIMTVCKAVLEAGDYLSYKTEGVYSNTSDSYHNIVLKSKNVNVKTGDEITFDEIVSSKDKFEKLFDSGKFTRVKSDVAADDVSSEDILLNYSPENGIYPDYYIDGENFVVIVQAPAAVGGIAEYKIHLLEARKFLDKNNEFVKMIFEG